MTDLPSTLARLVQLTVEAGRLAQTYRGDLRTTLKPDGSIVTQADQGVERMLRERLVELGAQRLRRHGPAPPMSAGHIVMVDPEGNEFCLD